MIKISTINGTAKKAALGVMLAGSVAAFASNPVRTAKPENPAQTEVVSKTGAEAMKALAYPQQQKSNVPTIHNKKLDEKCLRFCSTDEEKKHMSAYLSNIYNEYGSYLGSVVAQQSLDVNMFLKFLEGDIEILKNFECEYRISRAAAPEGKYYEVAKRYYTPETKEKIENLKNKVYDWVNENYFKIYADVFSTDHSPDYEETSKMFDKFFKSLDNYEFAPNKKMFQDLNLNYVGSGIYEEMGKSSSNETQKEMDMFAAKINYTDGLLFWNLSKIYYDPPSNIKMFRLYQIFMQAIEPKFD